MGNGHTRPIEKEGVLQDDGTGYRKIAARMRRGHQDGRGVHRRCAGARAGEELQRPAECLPVGAQEAGGRGPEPPAAIPRRRKRAQSHCKGYVLDEDQHEAGDGYLGRRHCRSDDGWLQHGREVAAQVSKPISGGQ